MRRLLKRLILWAIGYGWLRELRESEAYSRGWTDAERIILQRTSQQAFTEGARTGFVAGFQLASEDIRDQEDDL